MRNLFKFLLIALFTVMGLALQGAQAAEKLKIGFVYVGPVGDFGWSYRHDLGRQAIEAAFGDQVETSYVESVKEGADAERVIKQMVLSGHKLIFTTSFGFMNATKKIAEQYPEVKFEHALGFQRTPNMATFAVRAYESCYVAGIVAGKVTKTGIVGYVAGHAIPDSIADINAFTLGMRSVNPTAKMKVIYLNSWYDPGREAAVARVLIDQGADVIAQETNSPAPVQVAEERGVFSVGMASDTTRFGPNAHLSDIVFNWSDYYVGRTRAVLDGTWTSGDTWGGLASGMAQLSPFGQRIPADVVALAETARAEIMQGQRLVFQGPIRDNAGKEIVAAGGALTDEQIRGMNFYVEGVEGSLPGN